MNNMPMPKEYQQHVKSIYPEVRRQEYGNRGAGVVLVGFEVRLPSDRKVFDISAEEREQIYENMWADCALHVGGQFSDLMTDIEANDTLRDFLERKIRSIVKDPATADLLIPKNHPPFTRRPCGEHGYYEAFNRDNVTLVDGSTTRSSRSPSTESASRAAPSTSSTCSSAPPGSTLGRAD